mmetsp:Transcript_14341/g.35731  ORF Transcript_14341/g.35731 Transcript_14341/m.35731 type:complete len:733 (+) Transcript_14341:474-2672(+)
MVSKEDFACRFRVVSSRVCLYTSTSRSSALRFRSASARCSCSIFSCCIFCWRSSCCGSRLLVVPTSFAACSRSWSRRVNGVAAVVVVAAPTAWCADFSATSSAQDVGGSVLLSARYLWPWPSGSILRPADSSSPCLRSDQSSWFAASCVCRAVLSSSWRVSGKPGPPVSPVPLTAGWKPWLWSCSQLPSSTGKISTTSPAFAHLDTLRLRFRPGRVGAGASAENWSFACRGGSRKTASDFSSCTDSQERAEASATIGAATDDGDATNPLPPLCSNALVPVAFPGGFLADHRIVSEWPPAADSRQTLSCSSNVVSTSRAMTLLPTTPGSSKVLAVRSTSAAWESDVPLAAALSTLAPGGAPPTSSSTCTVSSRSNPRAPLPDPEAGTIRPLPSLRLRLSPPLTIKCCRRSSTVIAPRKILPLAVATSLESSSTSANVNVSVFGCTWLLFLPHDAPSEVALNCSEGTDAERRSRSRLSAACAAEIFFSFVRENSFAKKRRTRSDVLDEDDPDDRLLEDRLPTTAGSAASVVGAGDTSDDSALAGATFAGGKSGTADRVAEEEELLLVVVPRDGISLAVCWRAASSASDVRTDVSPPSFGAGSRASSASDTPPGPLLSPPTFVVLASNPTAATATELFTPTPPALTSFCSAPPPRKARAAFNLLRAFPKAEDAAAEEGAPDLMLLLLLAELDLLRAAFAFVPTFAVGEDFVDAVFTNAASLLPPPIFFFTAFRSF